MPWEIVKQPNNKYAVFSTVVDNFIVINASRGEVVSYCISRGLSEQDTESKVKRADDNCEHFSHSISKMPLARWNGAIVDVLSIHGKEAFDKIISLNDNEK